MSWKRLFFVLSQEIDFRASHVLRKHGCHAATYRKANHISVCIHSYHTQMCIYAFTYKFTDYPHKFLREIANSVKFHGRKSYLEVTGKTGRLFALPHCGSFYIIVT